MKLSEKGLGKLYNSKACYYDPDTEEEVIALSYFEHVFEFEPDDFDFDGMVVMPVYDAKILATALTHLNGWCQESYQNDIRKLNKRIDKAEGK